jgi:hypothetical protein
MDMNTMLKLLLSSDALGQVSKQAGVSENDAAAVLQDVLPILLKGMQGQASNKSTQQGFLQALADHSKEDTSDVSKFLSKVDTEDGSKIVRHLLGAEEEAVAAKAKKKSGIDAKKILKIMAIVAPLLMSQMGKSAKESKKTAAGNIGAADVLDIVSGLADGVDMKDVLKIAKMFAK